MADKLVYRPLTPEDSEAIGGLYRSVGWIAEDDTLDFIGPMLRGSFAAVGAWDGGVLAGMGRAVSDGASDGYIQDVAVHCSYRKKGIGGSIVRMLVHTLEAAGVDWIGLVGAPGTLDFYRGLGFDVLDEHIPMRYRADRKKS